MKAAIAFIVTAIVLHYGPWAVVAVLLVALGALGCIAYWLRNAAEEACGESAALNQQAAALTQQTGALAQEVGNLRHELEAAYRRIENLKRARPERWERDSSSEKVFAMVSLHPQCTKEIAGVVRRTFRKDFHPDRQPPHRRADATRQFQRYEQAFDEIWRLRGF